MTIKNDVPSAFSKFIEKANNANMILNKKHVFVKVKSRVEVFNGNKIIKTGLIHIVGCQN